jgi:nucleoside-diphosphate-sugar epimerase
MAGDGRIRLADLEADAGGSAGKPKRIYDSAKFMGENVCTYYHDNMGIETVSLRFRLDLRARARRAARPMAVMSRIVENPAHGPPVQARAGRR